MSMDEDDIEDAVMCEGIEEAGTKVKKFLLDLKRSPEVDGTITLYLEQTGRGQKEQVHSLEFDMRADIDELVLEIVDHASDDCMGLRAKSMKYTVTARDEEDSPLKGRATFTLKCPEQEDPEDIDDIDDLPNRSGLMGMLMRHQHGTMKLSIVATKQNMDLLREELRAKDRRIKDLEANQVKILQAYEELVSGRHVRDMEIRKLENAERRKDQAVGVFMNAAPIIAAKFMGGGAAAAQMQGPGPGPGGRTPLEGMLESFMGTISHEQLQKLVASGVFSQDQIMVLGEMFRYVMERQEAEHEKSNPQGEGQPAPVQS